MDRSALQYVETKDGQERLDARDRLARKVDAAIVENYASSPTPIGLTVGSKISHRDLGECVIDSIDTENNTIVLDFETRGLIPFSLSHITPWLGHFDHQDTERPPDDPWYLSDEVTQQVNCDKVKDTPIRASVRDKLGKKVELANVTSDPVTDVNGLQVGSKLTHRDLGKGTLHAIDRVNNTLTLDFESQGKVTFATNQILPWLSVDVDSGEDVSLDDCFIGDEIDRSPLDRPDVAYRLASDDGVKGLDDQPESYEIPVGSRVWHPKFGSCTVLLVDKKINEIILECADTSTVSLVLSQVRSILLPVTGSPEAATQPDPVKMSPVASIPEIQELTVELPESFYSLKEQDQFLYLKGTMKLTVEQANDVIFACKGLSPLQFKVSLLPEDTW